MKRHQSLGLALVLLVFGLLTPLAAAQAGTLSSVRDYLTRQQGNLASGETHQIFFTPATGLSGSANTVELRLPSTDQGLWCRTPGALTVAGLSNPSGGGENATALLGALTAACTAGGSGDVLTVSNVGPLTAGTHYGVAINDGVGRLGTPPPAQGIQVSLATTNGTTDVDTTVFFLSTISQDQVLISATVVGTTPPVNTNPVVTFTGYAAPAAALTITRDDQQLQTLTAQSDAGFSVTLADQPTGAHVYVVAGTDANGAALASLTFALSLNLNTTTIVSGVFLGPSITVDKAEVELGTPITLSGLTAPSSSVTVTVGSTPVDYGVTADAQGRWEKTVNTSTIGVGDHTAKARATTSGSVVSAYSAAVSFAVNPLNPAAGKAPSDLDIDGKVNLVDFSILLFYWHQRNPANLRADINHDGFVDIVDFSILLYQWTG